MIGSFVGRRQRGSGTCAQTGDSMQDGTGEGRRIPQAGNAGDMRIACLEKPERGKTRVALGARVVLGARVRASAAG